MPVIKIGDKKYPFKLSQVRNGIECAFIPLSSQRGVKVFFKARESNSSRRAQSIFYKLGFAPRVYSETLHVEFSCNIETNNDYHSLSFDRNDIYYGYITQKVRVVPSGSYCNDRQQELVSVLDKKLDKIGWDMCDRHDGNYGFLGNRAMLIDFGGESMDLDKVIKLNKKRKT